MSDSARDHEPYLESGKRWAPFRLLAASPVLWILSGAFCAWFFIQRDVLWEGPLGQDDRVNLLLFLVFGCLPLGVLSLVLLARTICSAMAQKRGGRLRLAIATVAIVLMALDIRMMWVARWIEEGRPALVYCGTDDVVREDAPHRVIYLRADGRWNLKYGERRWGEGTYVSSGGHFDLAKVSDSYRIESRYRLNGRVLMVDVEQDTVPLGGVNFHEGCWQRPAR